MTPSETLHPTDDLDDLDVDDLGEDEEQPQTAPVPSLLDTLRAVLPDNAHFSAGGLFALGAWSVTWTTSAGVWNVSQPGVFGGWVDVKGPGGEWIVTGTAAERNARVVALLRAVGAIPPLPDPDRPHGVPLAEVCAALLVPLTGHTDTTRTLPEGVERPPGDDRPERVCVSCGESWPCTSARIRDLYLSGDHERLVAVARDLARLAGASTESPTP
jgi:hypothetical protein